MNRNQFIQYIEHPENMDGNSIALLDGLIKEFPYFSTAHLLYAKNLCNENSIHYNAQLKITAAYASDRKILYRLIKKETSKIVAEEKMLAEESKTIVVETKKNEVIEIPKSDEVILELLGVKQQPMFVEFKEEKTPAQETSYPKVEGLDEVEKLESDKTKLNKEEFISAINASIEKEAGDEKMNEPMFINESDEHKTVLDKNSKYSFGDWLKAAETKNIIQDTTLEENRKSISELIDKFIDNEPRISKPKAEFFSPVDKARQSVTDSDELVTETLAKIYAQQGNYLKAIRSYEILIMKHPEKSATFATRIKELKRNIGQK